MMFKRIILTLSLAAFAIAIPVPPVGVSEVRGLAEGIVNAAGG